jgi:hypothetical protein
MPSLELVCLCACGVVLLVTVLVVYALLPRDRTCALVRTPIRAAQGTVVIVTGELRFDTEDALETFKRRLSQCTVVVSTWARCTAVARRLVDGDDSRMCTVDDAPPRGVPRAGAYQFFLLQHGVRHFRARLARASAVARMRTDAVYDETFTLDYGAIPPHVVYMETDHAALADAHTFITVYEDVWDQMVARRYYRHREEGRTILPNFENIARSDASNAHLPGWRTRWGWLQFPTRWARARGRDSLWRIPADVQTSLSELMQARAYSANVPAMHLASNNPVAEFDAESSFLHHTLERATVRVLRGVALLPREARCPFRGRCVS